MPAPTHARYKVVALATCLAVITHLDRACIATLAPGIMRDLGSRPEIACLQAISAQREKNARVAKPRQHAALCRLR